MQYSNDHGGCGWNLLGFFFPMIGLILYLVWKNEKPVTAKAVGTGALVNVIIGVATFVLYLIVVAILMMIGAATS